MRINTEAVHTTLLSNNRLIVANVMTGAYIKTNQIYFQVISDIMNQSDSLEDFFDTNAVEPEIKANLQQLYESLKKIGYFIGPNDLPVPMVNYDQIYLAVTNRCNLKCRHCCQGSEINESDHLTRDQICKMIDSVSLLHPKGVIFTGGEPLVRADILDILEYTKEIIQGQIILETNGLLINRDNVERILKSITGISISIDGYNEASCQRVRGSNAFGKVTAAIELLKEKGLTNISLSAIYSKDMEGHEKEFYALCEKYNATPIMRNLYFAGRASLCERELIPSNYITRLVEERGVTCRHCRAGERELYIDANADVYPCPLLQENELKCGNLLKEDCINSFRDKKIGETARLKMQRYRIWNNENCKRCHIGLFCQTCEAEYIMLRKNPELLQEFCDKKQELISAK